MRSFVICASDYGVSVSFVVKFHVFMLYVLMSYICCIYSCVTLLHSLTPRSRVLEKLTGSQLVKKFPAFYGTQRFITTFTIVRHLSLI